MAPMLSVKKNEMETSRLLVSGGPKISTSVVQVFINMHCWVGMPLFEAVAHPSIHDQLLYRGSDVPVLKAAL
jgi:gamma-glutamyltranspeptidase